MQQRRRGGAAPAQSTSRRGTGRSTAAWARVSAVAHTRASCVARASLGSGSFPSSMEEILEETDACGVGYVADLQNRPQHKVLADALRALGCMEHRGGCSADNDSGDGAGVMTHVPWKLLNTFLADSGIDETLSADSAGVAQLFLPMDADERARAKALIEEKMKASGMRIIGFRDVPVDESVVGKYAKVTMPFVCQMFVKPEDGATGEDLERELMVARRAVEKEAETRDIDMYVVSLSCRTITYKGMLRSVVVPQFYLDLVNTDYETGFAIYHRRFSTNTNPRWPLAQPFRMLGHNGEINTLQGNLNWSRGREKSMAHPLWGDSIKDFFPLVSSKDSDSANLDHAAEFLVHSGRPLDESMMILVPEAYKNHPTLARNSPEIVPFYEFYAGMQEAWDGPALLVFSDGITVGARLDRNGLRPARYWKTSDDLIYVASEVGVLGDVISNASNVVEKGRLGPGHIITVNLETGVFKRNAEVAQKVAASAPYGEWLESNDRIENDVYYPESQMGADDCMRLQAASGYGLEEVQMIIESMGANGKEPTFCMGDDVPLAVMSERPHLLYDYFKQRFAQVTNPPIDPLREGLVMSLEMRLGKRGNILQPSSACAEQLVLDSPILSEPEFEMAKAVPSMNAATIYPRFEAGKPGALREAIDTMCKDAADAVRGGANMLILSDKFESPEASHPPVPAMLAVGAVHHHLIREGIRCEASIVAETAQCFSTQHVACLVGYGASAVCPYLAFETVRQWLDLKKTKKMIDSGKIPALTKEDVQKNLKSALDAGLLKILSKMGISCLSSYHGAQIFEIYGLGEDVVNTSFVGSVSRIGGMSLDDVAREAEMFWSSAHTDVQKLKHYGFIQSRPNSEYHGNNPEMSKLLHQAVRQNSADSFKLFNEHVENRPANVLRDLLELESGLDPIDVSEVEPASSIIKRFCTGGMSLGAISRETHEVIAIAMNRLGGKSNSGEGGEDPVRYEVVADCDDDGKSDTFPHLKGMQNGDIAMSAIKQVASGRFGVTPHFLSNAEQIEIKVAQGAKPGEGGQLPGKKVSPYIAGLRRSKPGVPLISPPPHHDIYSIEDLAQLIYDLHMINEKAKVSVKLVAEAGIGTIASGVAKANSDVIQISGHDGGTGASPISSIKHCGGPVEMGLVETHQALLANGLRERVALRVDGGLRSGRDVLMTAAMGADEFGFGTVAMIATGCIMARVCHLNTCPVGVASQKEELRKRFPGMASDVVNFFAFVSEEVRSGLAALGFRTIDELIGRTDILKARKVATALPKTSNLDLSYLLQYNGLAENLSSERIAQPTHGNGPVLDDIILADKEIQLAIEHESSVDKTFEIINTDRSALTRVGGCVASKYGDGGFAGNLNLTLLGSSGQSFAAFIVAGMNIRLIGEANDYVAKGMAGGEIVIVPPEDAGFDKSKSVIAGNTCLYGATGGVLFLNGIAGERFAVRNSLGEAVIEGAGDHCCEYMTGGCVVSLGKVGRNVAAGMTGGIGYFLDEDNRFLERVNGEIVKVQRIQTAAGEQQVKMLIETHYERTKSPKAAEVLGDWDKFKQLFWQIVPPSEQGTPEASDEGITLDSATSAANKTEGSIAKS